MLCMCLIRATVSVGSLPRHGCHKQDRRQPESPAAASVPDAEDNQQDNSSLAGEKQICRRRSRMLSHCWILNASLLFPILEREAPCVLVDLCRLRVPFAGGFPSVQSEAVRGKGFFFLDCATQMSRPNPDAVALVCCSQL